MDVWHVLNLESIMRMLNASKFVILNIVELLGCMFWFAIGIFFVLGNV